MKLRAMTLAAVTVGVAVSGCGSSHHTGSANSATSIQDTKAPAGVNQVALVTGSDQDRITAAIRGFYKATWQNEGTLACSFFNKQGLAGFMSAAKVAFPASVNQATTCPDVMRYFNADLSDSADTLQQSGVNVSGNVLNVVGVSKIQVTGTTATAQAPEGVEEFIAPKTFHLVRDTSGRWLISGSSKIGQSLDQALQAAKAKGEVPKTSSSSSSSSGSGSGSGSGSAG